MSKLYFSMMDKKSVSNGLDKKRVLMAKKGRQLLTQPLNMLSGQRLTACNSVRAPFVDIQESLNCAWV